MGGDDRWRCFAVQVCSPCCIHKGAFLCLNAGKLDHIERVMRNFQNNKIPPDENRSVWSGPKTMTTRTRDHTVEMEVDCIGAANRKLVVFGWIEFLVH